MFYHVVDQLLDGLLVWRREGISLHDNSLAVMNHVTLLKTPLAEIFMATEETREIGPYHSPSLPILSNQLASAFEGEIDMGTDVLLTEHGVEASLMEHSLHLLVDTGEHHLDALTL